MRWSWQARIDNYAKVTGFPPAMYVTPGGYVIGMWRMGNDYRVKSSFYGGYPAGYLRRVKALFPEKSKVLHLFSGKVDLDVCPGDTVDILPELNPTYLDDAQKLETVPLGKYDLVLVDPPYSVEDALHYGTTMIKRTLVMRALRRLAPGTHVVWLDQVQPMYAKAYFRQEAGIAMQKSTNHRVREVFVFCRTKKEFP